MTDPDEITSEFPERKPMATETSAVQRVLSLRESVKKCYMEAANIRASRDLRNGKIEATEMVIRHLLDTLAILDRTAETLRAEEK